MKANLKVIGKTDLQTALINELPQIVQSRVAFNRLNGSMGNITAYDGRDGSMLLRRKSKCVCPNTAPQVRCQNAMARANAAWVEIGDELRALWHSHGRKVMSHTSSRFGDAWISGYELFIECYLGLVAAGLEGIPSHERPLKVPSIWLELCSIRESDYETLVFECTALPCVPDGYLTNARIRVHVDGYRCNQGYKPRVDGLCTDGHHVTFTLTDYRERFKIGDIRNRKVSVLIEYDLTDAMSGLHWKDRKKLEHIFISPINGIREIISSNAGATI